MVEGTTHLTTPPPSFTLPTRRFTAPPPLSWRRGPIAARLLITAIYTLNTARAFSFFIFLTQSISVTLSISLTLSIFLTLAASPFWQRGSFAS